MTKNTGDVLSLDIYGVQTSLSNKISGYAVNKNIHIHWKGQKFRFQLKTEKRYAKLQKNEDRKHQTINIVYTSFPAF